MPGISQPLNIASTPKRPESQDLPLLATARTQAQLNKKMFVTVHQAKQRTS